MTSPNEELYPNWGKIYIKYTYLQDIHKIIKDLIRLNIDKRKQLFPIIQKISEKVIHLGEIDMKNYIESKVCYLIKDDCSYPCKMIQHKKNKVCKLVIPTNSFDHKNLLSKYMWKFIDLLLIHDGDLEKVIKYKIEPYELEKTRKPSEIFFSFR